MDDKAGWIEGLPAAITVTDASGTIVAMNGAAQRAFADDGGASLIGTSLLDCHPEPARTLLAALYAGRRENHYTITKSGRRKIIHQLPWYQEGAFAGLVELSIPIPDHLPHQDRDAPAPR
jgi:transcriptional regulator with PAS, ATPase and Fis domain